MSLDADEALSADLTRGIRERLAGNLDGVDGFEARRVTFHLGRWIRHGDFYPDRQLRVFRRTAGAWSGSNPHGQHADAYHAHSWHAEHAEPCLADAVDARIPRVAEPHHADTGAGRGWPWRPDHRRAWDQRRSRPEPMGGSGGRSTRIAS